MKRVKRSEIDRKLSDIKERLSSRIIRYGVYSDTSVTDRMQTSGAAEARKKMIERHVKGTGSGAAEARRRMIERHTR